MCQLDSRAVLNLESDFVISCHPRSILSKLDPLSERMYTLFER